MLLLGWLRKLALLVAAGTLLLAILLFRAHRAGTDAMAESDAAFNRGDLLQAVDSAREAAGWYFPGAPHVAEARTRLVAVAAGAEATGDATTALRTWGATRGVLMETQHPWGVRDPLLDQANASIARLLPRPESMLGPTPTIDEVQAAFERSRGTEPVFFFATTLAVVLMLLGARLSLTRRAMQQMSWGWVIGCLGLFLWVFAAIGA
jgi:hypothetical protein